MIEIQIVAKAENMNNPREVVVHFNQADHGGAGDMIIHGSSYKYDTIAGKLNEQIHIVTLRCIELVGGDMDMDSFIKMIFLLLQTANNIHVLENNDV